MAARIARAAVVAGLIAAASAAALLAPPSARATAFCDYSSGHAMQVRRFLTSRVALYSLEGENVASVSRNDLRGVTTAVQCDNTSSYVKLDTPFGARLARRSSLALGGGLGPPCRCPSQLASNEHQSNSARNASSMGAGEGAICNADLPCAH